MLMASDALFTIALLTRNADGKRLFNRAYLILPKVPPCIIRVTSKAAQLITHIAAGLHTCWCPEIALQQVMPVPLTLPVADITTQLQNRQSDADTNQPIYE